MVFAAVLARGATMGLTDDEAYYWVLAQKPSLGYAFHPPAVAWFIALFQSIFGWVVGVHQPGLVRLPAAMSTAFILALSLSWLEQVGMKSSNRNRAAVVLLS